MRTKGFVRRGPRATEPEQVGSFVHRFHKRTGEIDKWQLPETGRARRKRDEARERVQQPFVHRHYPGNTGAAYHLACGEPLNLSDEVQS